MNENLSIEKNRVIAAVNSWSAELKFLELAVSMSKIDGKRHAKLDDVIDRVIDRGVFVARAQSILNNNSEF